MIKMTKIYIQLFHNLLDLHINKQTNTDKLADNQLSQFIILLKGKFKYKIR